MTTLRPYQIEHAFKILNSIYKNRSVLDASDTGTGKMYVACWLAKELGVIPLVIAPKSTLIKWREVSAEFDLLIEAVNYEKIRGVRRKGKSAESVWGREVECGQGSRWQWAYPYELIIFDEGHFCGGMTSLNSKLLIAARRQAKHVLCLSATAADDPRDMKALGYALRMFEMREFKWWLLKHGCAPGIWGGFALSEDKLVVQKAMSDLHKEIFDTGRGARMRKNEIPGFPKTQIEVRLIEDETGEAAKIGCEMVTAYEENVLEKLTRARQKLELLKVSHFVEMAEIYGRTSQVVIFVNFKKTAERLREAFSQKPPIIDGSNTAEERARIVDQFQAGEIPVLICNNQAGGVGIGLHDPTGRIERTCLISPSYRVKDMKQVLGRSHRDGGAFSRQFLIYFACTVEQMIAEAVQNGLQNIDLLNDNQLNGVFI